MENNPGATTKLAISLRPLFSFGWRMLLMLTSCRVIFVAWQWQRVVDADMLGSVFFQGLKFDLVLLGLMLVVQFDSRPNILFLEYLVHPRNVGTTLWATYKLPIGVAVLFASTITLINSRQIGRLVTPIRPTGVVPAILVAPILLILCLSLIRSTLD